MHTPHPEKLGSKYILLDIIGTGGMAEVYRGKLVGDNGFEKLIVIKKLLPHIAKNQEMVEHFTNEARLAALLQHENITCIYDYGELEESFFIVMEYLFGKDLSSIIARLKKVDRKFAPELALMIMAKVCEGMRYAHSLCDYLETPLNLIHRDISPQNIFLTYDGKVKVLDFGIAKSDNHDLKTRVGVVKGKMNYMSPEQIMGESIDSRSDIFSMGILLYEMLSGIQLYSGDTGTVIRKSVQAEYKPLEEIDPSLPKPIYKILHKAICRDLDSRYQNCGEMLHDITACLQELAVHQEPHILQNFLRTTFASEYEKEKESAKNILNAKPQKQPQEQFDKTIFIQPESTPIDSEPESMRYAQKNTADKVVIKKEPTEPTVSEPVNPRPQPRLGPTNLEPPPPKKDQTMPAIKLPSTSQQAEKKEVKKPKVSIGIAIQNDEHKGPGKAYNKIDIEPTGRPVNRRVKSGLDLSNILQSFGPFLISILALIAAASYYFTNIYTESTTDIFANVHAPQIPAPLEMTEISESKKEILLFKLILKGESAIADGKLVFPEAESAFTHFSQVKYIDPKNQTATEQLAAIAKQLAHQADVAIQKNQKQEAAILIVSGLIVDPENQKLLKLKQELEK